MLIRDAELAFGRDCADLRIEHGRITDIAPRLQRQSGEAEYLAQGAALIPALRDHHLHLYATAAARTSVDCGPAAVATLDDLASVLRAADARLPAGEMLRAVGVDDSLAGEARVLDRAVLDAVLPDRPVRLQHRSGRLWVLNTAALDRLGPLSADDPPERDAQGRPTGRLLDADRWLRQRLGGQRPSLESLSRALAGWGVTAVTDTGHDNDRDRWHALAAAQDSGELLQDLRVMGDRSLDAVVSDSPRRAVGARKFHLHEHDLPPLDMVVAAITEAHHAGRGAAFHCVTRTELVFALGALEAAGVGADDRIEHAAVAPPALTSWMARLGLSVVTQPVFIAERGDRYRRQVEADDQPWLYRLAGLQAAGVGLALSSDAPYGSVNPWRGMQAAVDRRTASGAVIGADEALGPEAALSGYLGDLATPTRPRRVAIGAIADLCLLPAPWAALRSNLAEIRPRAVWQGGRWVAAADQGPDFTSME